MSHTSAHHAAHPAHEHAHDHDHDHGHDHEHGGGHAAGWRAHAGLLAGMLIWLVMLVLRYGFQVVPPAFIDFIVHAAAYLLSGWSVLLLALRGMKRGDIFNEFFLMTVAAWGAFYLRAYSEGVAVMIFYCIGEWFQDEAVANARRSIKALLDIRPDKVTVLRHEAATVVKPTDVKVGETIRVKPGEKAALDGILLSESAFWNTAALTGESKPDTKYKGDVVLAGMINGNTVADIQVTTLFTDSRLSRILTMVQDATARKSKTQLFISRFARMYTPAVFALALLVCVLPALLVKEYHFSDWLYRALVFLVASCPCALVVSIPLGYFGGISLASRNGILFKGGNFLDVMTRINTVVMDKTGTLTKGVFTVQRVAAAEGVSEQEVLAVAKALEQYSTHPVAQAIMTYGGAEAPEGALQAEEKAGHGITGKVNGQPAMAGNARLLQLHGIEYPAELNSESGTLVLVAVNGKYIGAVLIADELKEDALTAVQQLQQLQLRTVILSGDKQSVVNLVAGQLGVAEAYGDLLPEQKVARMQQLKEQGARAAFAGDGINDAPVLALADAGIAMGGLGSDVAVETADIVIQSDQPSRIAAAVKAGKITRRAVWQNITLAMTVKVMVLILGAGGIATLWEAVIADVGVALLAILNAVRVQRARL